MAYSDFPNGVTSFGVPVVGSGVLPIGQHYFFVDSNRGSNGNTGGYEDPLATIDYAIGKCTANRGDVIAVCAGHAETLTGASAITCDVAGINIIGIGTGADRPELTFSTSTAASVVISAANVAIRNIVGIAGIDGLTNPFHVQAAGCTLDIEWQDGSSTVEAARAILTTAAADKASFRLKYIGFPAGNACVNAIRLVGGNDIRCEVDLYGLASTAWVEFLTTACTNVNVCGYMYNSGTTTGAKNVVDTVTASTWFAEIYDGAAGQKFHGGSATGGIVSTLAGAHMVSIASGMQLSAGDELAVVSAGGPILVHHIALFTVSAAENNDTVVLDNITTGASGDLYGSSQEFDIEADTVGAGDVIVAGQTGFSLMESAGQVEDSRGLNWLIQASDTIDITGAGAEEVEGVSTAIITYTSLGGELEVE